MNPDLVYIEKLVNSTAKCVSDDIKLFLIWDNFFLMQEPENQRLKLSCIVTASNPRPNIVPSSLAFPEWRPPVLNKGLKTNHLKPDPTRKPPHKALKTNHSKLDPKKGLKTNIKTMGLKTNHLDLNARKSLKRNQMNYQSRASWQKALNQSTGALNPQRETKDLNEENEDGENSEIENNTRKDAAPNVEEENEVGHEGLETRV